MESITLPPLPPALLHKGTQNYINADMKTVYVLVHVKTMFFIFCISYP